MSRGNLVAIFISSYAGGRMVAVDQVRAVPGQGLEGDRYFHRTGTYSNKIDPGQEVTLIEIETLEALARDYGINLELGDSRRNLVTRRAALNHLVGREFRIGEVTLKGIRLCEPCSHLAKLTRRDVLPALVHRGGLRAQILTAGTIRVGDDIEENQV